MTDEITHNPFWNWSNPCRKECGCGCGRICNNNTGHTGKCGGYGKASQWPERYEYHWFEPELYTIDEIDKQDLNQWGYPNDPWVFAGSIDGESRYYIEVDYDWRQTNAR